MTATHSSAKNSNGTPDGIALKEEQLLDLWKYFQGTGNQIKHSMIRAVTWVVALALGILSYSVARFDGFQGFRGFRLIAENDKPLARTIALFGIGLCAYGVFLILIFRRPMVENWSNAHQLWKRIRRSDTEQLVVGEVSNFPKSCRAMLIPVGILGLVFLCSLVAAW